MSAPKLIVQIAVVGAQILGRAALAAGRQAVQNAKHRPGVVAEEVTGLKNGGSGSATDILTREHRLTLDEAHLILNTKRGEPLEDVLKNYEHLFKANSPRDPPPKAPTGRPAPPQYHSHYLQSKVVRARERIEAELQIMEELESKSESQPQAAPSESTPPPPPSSPNP